MANLNIRDIDDMALLEDKLRQDENDRKRKKTNRNHSRFNNHQIDTWVDKQVSTKSSNQKRIDRKRVYTGLKLDPDKHIGEDLSHLPKAQDYREDLVEYIGKSLTFKGNILHIRKYLKYTRLTIGEIVIGKEKSSIDHMNVIVNNIWMGENEECKVGALYKFRGVIHEYQKVQNVRNIGCFAKSAKLINKAVMENKDV